MKTLKDIQSARVAALKSGHKKRASIISLLADEVQKIAKNDTVTPNRAPTDADVIAAARRSVKRAQETLSFITAPSERADDLREEIAVYEEFLPKQLSEDELREAIRRAVAAVPITSGPGIGAVMKYLVANHAGQYDPKAVKPILDSL